MPETAQRAPGYVSPYTRPRCPALYTGVMHPTMLRCDRIEHPKDRRHEAVLPPLEGREEPRTVSWV